MQPPYERKATAFQIISLVGYSFSICSPQGEHPTFSPNQYLQSVILETTHEILQTAESSATYSS